MQYVIIDTSSMLFGFSFRKNVFDAARDRFPGSKQLVSKGIISELNRLSTNKGKKGACARLALLEIKAKRVGVEGITTHADSWVLSESQKINAIAITNDTELTKKLARANVKVFKLSKSGMLKQIN